MPHNPRSHASEPSASCCPSTGARLACNFSTAIEAAGDAWAPSLRAALPIYRHNPTVRIRLTPCRYSTRRRQWLVYSIVTSTTYRLNYSFPVNELLVMWAVFGRAALHPVGSSCNTAAPARILDQDGFVTNQADALVGRRVRSSFDRVSVSPLLVVLIDSSFVPVRLPWPGR